MTVDVRDFGCLVSVGAARLPCCVFLPTDDRLWDPALRSLLKATMSFDLLSVLPSAVTTEALWMWPVGGRLFVSLDLSCLS